MKLLDYVKTRATQSELATKLAITPVLVNQWANRKRPVPPDRCVDIERATEGAVTRPELRPDDWHRIWPELVPGPDAGSSGVQVCESAARVDDAETAPAMPKRRATDSEEFSNE
ncbi:transcriptional regulator [Massilia sp. CMS3.1]|uniref:transcriptional regulator n=1 Tax=Massilia sp. CMS3.1 TaxID=3373083 RepID=UPI003EE61265